MSEMNDFNIDFVRRTLYNINHHEGIKYEVTFLLNCLCGLVNLPIEIKKDDCTKEIDDFKEKCVKKLASLCSKSDFYERQYFETFSDIRNSIAHFNIKIPKDGKKIDKIKLKAYSNNKVVFRITISVENLKEFAQFVANEYLKIV